MTVTRRKLSNESGRSAPSAFRSLLVPVDLTPISDRVVSRVSLLPLVDDVRVTLLHVVPGGLPASEQRSAERDAHKALGEEVRHLRRLVPKKAKIESLVRRGSAAATEIAACASKVKAELIVMGRAGGSPLRDAVLGSTAERVFRQARVPVLAVRLAARGPYHRPLLALDFDPAAHEAIRLLLRMLQPPRPSVEVVHAFDTPYRRLIYPSLSQDEAEEMETELSTKATRELETLLATVLAEAEVPREDAPCWKTHVRCGPPRMLVEKAMKKAQTDLLVLGSRGHSGAAYMLLGTVAGDLLRAAKCDVLVVPPVPAA